MKLYKVFRAVALVLSHAMCILVTYEFCARRWCQNQYALANPARAWLAFIDAVPFVVGIVACLIVAYILRGRSGGHRR